MTQYRKVFARPIYMKMSNLLLFFWWEKKRRKGYTQRGGLRSESLNQRFTEEIGHGPQGKSIQTSQG